MELLSIAAALARRIPSHPEYLDERQFCWLAVGQAAVRLGRDDLVREALAALRGRGEEVDLRWSVLEESNGQLAREILHDYFDRFSEWEPQLWRGELSDLAAYLARDFGLSKAHELAARISDPFTRTCYLTDLVGTTSDIVLKRTLALEAWNAAETVRGDHDYALKHAVSALLDARLFDEAAGAVNCMKDPAIKLDYLRSLQDSLAAAGAHAEAEEVHDARAQLAADSPGLQSQSEILEEAVRLMRMDWPDGPPSNRTVAVQVDAMIAAGAQQQAADDLLERFPTQFIPAVLQMDPDLQVRVLMSQLDAVASYRRNDLKVEFLLDASRGFREAGLILPDAVLERASSDEFLVVEPPSVPSIHSRDPSQMSFEEFVSFLFERPVAATEEEQRFMQRDSLRDPDVEDYSRLVQRSAELFRRFGETAPQYSEAQVEQAIWHLHGHPFWILQRLVDRVPPQDARNCIEAGYHVFADYVAKQQLSDEVSGFNMFWDQWREELPSELALTVLETLKRILELDDDDCRYAALHGLNHLHPHPGAGEAIDAWLRSNKVSPEMLAYAQACRSGEAM